MRSLGRLLRLAARRASLQVGSQADAAGGSLGGAAVGPVRTLAAQWPAGQPLCRHQQAAGYAAGRREGELEEELEEGTQGTGRLHSRPSHRALLDRAEREVAADKELEEEVALEQQRHQRIRQLLESQGGVPGAEGATAFLDSFFAGDGEDEPAATAGAAAAGEGAEGEDEGEEGWGAEEQEAWSDEEGALSDDEALAGADSSLSQEQEFDLSRHLAGLRKGAQRVMLQKLLQGGMLEVDPEAMQEWKEIQEQLQPPDDFMMKVVDVNYTCKGTKSGGLYRYSCMVVVGNGDGVLGWGVGKAAETADAVQKAYMRACKNLFPVPRYNGHTITEPMTSKYGKVKVIMYPKAAGNGIVANSLIYDICKMAGLHDVGVKVYGSRNARNTVKCLFDAFDKLRTDDEILEQKNRIVVPLLTGRYAKFSGLLSRNSR